MHFNSSSICSLIILPRITAVANRLHISGAADVIGKFLACDSIQRICLAPVRLPVCHMDGSYKTVEVRIMIFAPYGSSIPPVFA